MFTGIIEETGVLKEQNGGNLVIQADKVLEDVHLGDSIAVNGVCLTVTEFQKNWFRADVMAETLRRSSLGTLKKGQPGESGTGHGSERTLWRPYRQRPHRRHRNGRKPCRERATPSG